MKEESRKQLELALQEIKELKALDATDFFEYGIQKIEKELDKTVYAATREIRDLNTISADDYADAVLGRSSRGDYITDILLNRFPQETAESKYEAWVDEIQEVQKIAEKYKGKIQVDNFLLNGFLDTNRDSNTIPDDKIYVKITVPGQDKLGLMRCIQELVQNYETKEKK